MLIFISIFSNATQGFKRCVKSIVIDFSGTGTPLESECTFITQNVLLQGGGLQKFHIHQAVSPSVLSLFGFHS